MHIVLFILAGVVAARIKRRPFVGLQSQVCGFTIHHEDTPQAVGWFQSIATSNSDERQLVPHIFSNSSELVFYLNDMVLEAEDEAEGALDDEPLVLALNPATRGIELLPDTREKGVLGNYVKVLASIQSDYSMRFYQEDDLEQWRPGLGLQYTALGVFQYILLNDKLVGIYPEFTMYAQWYGDCTESDPA